MGGYTFFKGIVLFGLILSASNLYGFVDDDSIFDEARYPASLLDLELMKKEMEWRSTVVMNQTEKVRKALPLITKSEVIIHLDYYNDDKISASGWINNLKGFLSFSQEDRKKLVKNIVKQLHYFLMVDVRLVDKITGNRAGGLEQEHIKLSLIISNLMLDQKDQPIRFLLPLVQDIGQAGYNNGQFVYSEDYYLKLQVIGDKAKSGDITKFVIEKESKKVGDE